MFITINTIVNATASAYPSPNYDVWDFDPATIGFDTSVAAATETAVEAAIAAALGNAGTVGNPKYHEIEYTGGDDAGSWNLSTGAAIPAKGEVFILLKTAAYTKISSGIAIGSGVSDIKFTGFRFEPSSSDLAGGLARCITPSGVGSGRRLSFDDCQFGAHWRSGAVTTFPEVIGGAALSGWEITIKNCDARGIFQFGDLRAGYYHFENNFVTQLVDDFAACTVRTAAPNICYLYAARNVITDMVDDVAHNGYHPDFIQTGVPVDGPGDSYDLQAFGNIFIGDTYRQYPTHFGIIQNEGSANGMTQDAQDNVMLVTGLRGWWTEDRTLTFKRNFMAWPPLGGAVPTSGTGWAGGPYRQQVRASGDLRPGGTTVMSNYVAGQNASAGAWAPADPDFIVDHTASLGGANAYDTRFPAMAGLAFNGSTLIIDNGFAAVTRTRAAIRAWVGATYAPTNGANVGWVANGFINPVDF